MVFLLGNYLMSRFDVSTIVLMVGAVFAIADPFLLGLGKYIQAHSVIVFSDEYLGIVKQSVATLATVIFTIWHGKTTPTDLGVTK